MSDDPPWLTISDAAKKLGVTQQAIKNRINRGTLTTSRNNRGLITVQLPSTVSGAADTVEQHTVSRTVSQPLPAAPLSGAADRFIEHLERQIVDQHAQHRAEIIERDAKHREEIERMSASQAEMRQQHQQELDRAEGRHKAEIQRLENAYKSAMNALMDKIATVMLVNRPRYPWWRRLIG